LARVEFVDRDGEQNDEALDTCCQNGEMLRRKSPLFSTPMMRQPRTVPQIEPRPPESEVPPITTAAMESSS